jgi:hypothetical protein
MPACVAVTCWGWGDVWGFESSEDARLHPLIDTCDVILSSAEDVYPRNWNYLFLPRMCAEVLGDRAARDKIADIIQNAPDEKTRDSRLALASVEIWNRLCDVAKPPPREPRKICEMIVRDRQRTDEWHRREEARRRTVMTEATTQEKPAAKMVAGFASTAKITLLKDKEGKQYGSANNPKRANSASATLFAKYRDGMTVQQAVDAGISAAALRWDKEHSFINIA